MHEQPILAVEIFLAAIIGKEFLISPVGANSLIQYAAKSGKDLFCKMLLYVEGGVQSRVVPQLSRSCRRGG